jgi:formamidopyrimidine-DNA glycosylase
VEAGGASIDSYRDGLGRRGRMQDLLRVHLHAGEPCRRCRATIQKTRVAQRGTYWCPRCQLPPPAPC